MAESDYRHGVDSIILKISTSVGCELPTTQTLLEAMFDDITALFSFGYNKLTIDEVLFAIDLNKKINLPLPTGIEFDEVIFNSKMVNTTFLSKVLRNYVAIRDLLAAKIKNFQDGY